jgi:ABC-type multidrug transport system ATPase subunit
MRVWFLPALRPGCPPTGARPGRRVGELLDRSGLTAAADRLVSICSGGVRRGLDLACSLIVAPRVLFLGRPATGLDAAGGSGCGAERGGGRGA